MIDWDFIKEREGKAILKAYVPDPHGSQSGVTVASGVDLGQQTREGLESYNLPHELVTKLLPYLGLKKQAAVSALQKQPLVLTRKEAEALDRIVHREHYNALVREYNKASAVPFDKIPDAAQTIICSVAYQYGTALHRRTPNFWRIVTNQDWPKAIRALRNFNDRYPTRRNLEADYLEKNLPKVIDA